MSNDRFETVCVFPPTSAMMLNMLIYCYWFQFPRLYLLEAVSLKLQPCRIWIKILGITNAFQLCLAEQWLLNELHCVCASVKANEHEVMAAFCLARSNPAAGLLADLGLLAANCVEAWVILNNSQFQRCVWCLKPLVRCFSPKRGFERPLSVNGLSFSDTFKI